AIEAGIYFLGDSCCYRRRGRNRDYTGRVFVAYAANKTQRCSFLDLSIATSCYLDRIDFRLPPYCPAAKASGCTHHYRFSTVDSGSVCSCLRRHLVLASTATATGSPGHLDRRTRLSFHPL